MISINDLFTRADYEYVMDSVLKRADFEIVRSFKKINYTIYNGNYACDGIGFNKGDYFVGFSINKTYGNYAGCGFTKTLTEFYEVFTTYEKARIYMTEQLSRYSNEQIICDTENEQLSFF